MYTTTIDHFAHSAERRITQLQQNPWGFWVGAMAGGAYIGLGILLILSVGQHLAPEFQKLGMGLTFAIALILVTIAGAELVTGYALYMTLGCLAGRVSLRNAAFSTLACWLGNLLGALLVASLFALGGANGLFEGPDSILFKIADSKVHAGPMALLAKAVLCNWLVCLALWMSSRVDSDVARCVVIFWCLLAFITSGYEHSVANMTLLSLAVIGHGGDFSMLLGALYNLLFVTVGNLMGGALLVAGSYWVVDRGARSSVQSVNHQTPNQHL